jgi:hypothetical protein
MTSLPYRFLCTRCAATIVSPTYDQPTGATCAESDFEHEWHRQVDPRRVAFHEAAHAIAAAVLLGTDCVRLVRLERPAQSDTLFIGHPASPQALLVALCGPAASARVGDVRDGTDGDLREFRRRELLRSLAVPSLLSPTRSLATGPLRLTRTDSGVLGMAT